MIRPIKTYSAEKTVKVLSHVEIMEIQPGKGLFAFREKGSFEELSKSEESTFEPGERGNYTLSREGLLDQEGVDDLLAGKPITPLKLSLVSLELIERVRLNGFSKHYDDFHEGMGKGLWEKLMEDPSITTENFVIADYSTHMLSDWKGRPHPQAVIFTYIENRMSESTHDLRAVAAHLLNRKDVTVFKEMHERGNIEATSVKDALFSIPHYNAEEGRTTSVQFIWSPGHAEYEKLMASAKKSIKASKYKISPSTLREIVLSQDLLGIDQFKLEKPSKRPRLR